MFRNARAHVSATLAAAPIGDTSTGLCHAVRTPSSSHSAGQLARRGQPPIAEMCSANRSTPPSGPPDRVGHRRHQLTDSRSHGDAERTSGSRS